MNHPDTRNTFSRFAKNVLSKKRTKICLAVTGILLLFGGIKAGTYYHYYLRPQFHPAQTVYIHIDRDDLTDSIYDKIKKEGAPTNLEGFRRLSEQYRYAENIRRGRYAIHPGDNARTLFFRLSRGHQTPKNLVIGSVRTSDMLARNIGKQLMADSMEIVEKLYDFVSREEAEFKEETLMCLFIPNTYQVYWNVSPEELFSRMKKEYKRFWNEDRLAKAEEIGLTPEEVITLASIVEEETNIAGERPVVAGLYINRLKKRMLLQADPTVKFAWQDFELRRITNRHLEINSPYNTYKYAGLPPGPIRNPSIRSIDSVLNYAKHNYLYMCAKEDFSGTHNFAVNLSGHNVNAKKYQQALNQRKIFR